MSLLIVTGCSGKPFIVKQTNISVPTSKQIFIVSHGWHTGFVVPAKTILAQLPQLANLFGETSFIEFGWGDKGFYQAEEITSGLTLSAVLWPTESVVHVVSVPEKPIVYFSSSEVIALCLNRKQYALLISFIEHSFSKDSSGNIIKLKKGIYGNSQFYKGEGDYYLMNTCNKWTAKGLNSAQVNISPAFKLSADSVMDFLSSYKNGRIKGACGINVTDPASDLK